LQKFKGLKNKRSVQVFKIIGVLEAISFLVLLFVAMPAKYFFGEPKAVEVVGMAHGILFVLYIIGTYLMYEILNWRLKTAGIFALCSIIPFGPFYAEKKYLK
jgi:integral membrane protein